MKKSLIQIISFLILFIYSFEKELNSIIYTEEQSIGILTINYPKESIDLNQELLEEMENVLNKIDINKINVLIITENSYKGNDINLPCIQNENINSKIFDKLEEFKIPIITAIKN